MESYFVTASSVEKLASLVLPPVLRNQILSQMIILVAIFLKVPVRRYFQHPKIGYDIILHRWSTVPHGVCFPSLQGIINSPN
jgi:hypothetical protein